MPMIYSVTNTLVRVASSRPDGTGEYRHATTSTFGRNSEAMLVVLGTNNATVMSHLVSKANNPDTGTKQ